jgi:hypothetical protein
MNMGVEIEPWGVVSEPRRARLEPSFFIISNSIADKDYLCVLRLLWLHGPLWGTDYQLLINSAIFFNRVNCKP